ncbi:MAG: hypothetical protein JWL71_1935 [Acidobacteria bacterium]|nr:hypothetical protein [Acidobacteriota bacterium]
MTSDEFVELYDCASDLVHVGNPYFGTQVYLRLRLDQWLGRIRRLLEWRGVMLLHETERLIINIASQPTEAVQCLIAGPSPT